MTAAKRTHTFHLVDPSPWPLFASIAMLLLTVGGVMFMHSYERGGWCVLFGLVNLIFILSCWWRDIIREATYQQKHSIKVQQGLKIGMILFIVSEIMFFFSFFWVYFHASFNAIFQIGSVWPPKGIQLFYPLGVPFLNTIILLLSGVAVTIVHYSIILNDRNKAFKNFIFTLLLATLFTSLQVYEYINSPFSFFDSIYGSTFFILTGFHVLHVIIGSIFILVCLFRFVKYHFTKEQHVGLEAAIWYWHFVDVVWIFVFICIYVWSFYFPLTLTI